MSDNKVNLQALFDQESQRQPQASYSPSLEQRNLLSKKAFARVYSAEELEGMRQRAKSSPTYRLKVLREKDVLTEQEQQEVKTIEEKLRNRKRRPHGPQGAHTDEHRAAIGKAHLGRKHSEEHKQRQSQGAKKRWEENPYTPTEEVRKKRSEGLKKYWAERKANMPPKAVEPPKKRGRPRTRPLPDPNAPPKRRGRPPKVSSH